LKSQAASARGPPAPVSEENKNAIIAAIESFYEKISILNKWSGNRDMEDLLKHIAQARVLKYRAVKKVWTFSGRLSKNPKSAIFVFVSC